MSHSKKKYAISFYSDLTLTAYFYDCVFKSLCFMLEWNTTIHMLLKNSPRNDILYYSVPVQL